jgi:hypothetical protein
VFLDPDELSGPGIVVLAEDPRLPLPCEDLRVDGDGLAGLLDGRWRSWSGEDVWSARWLEPGPGGVMVHIKRGRWVSGIGKLAIGEARAQFRRRPPSLAGTAAREPFPGRPS